MPISQLGAVNISAVNVPDVYVQIVLPQFLFAGVSTNKGGFVGTASWGPVNAAQPFATYTQYGTVFGPTVVRTYDMGAHVSLASMQGGAGAYYGVRITDGTDTAASGVINATGAVAASGNIVFSAQPTASSLLTLGGTVWTFVSALTTGNQILIGASLSATLTNAVATLQASTDTNTVKFTYSANATTLYLMAATTGTSGNTLTIVAGLSPATNGTTSGATLSGGTAAVLGVTFTGKWTGSLGNSISVALGQGSQNLLATAASGTINFLSNPTAATTITLNGTAWSFVASGPTGTQILIGSTLASTLANVITTLQMSSDVNTSKIKFAINTITNQLTLTAKGAGTGGNALTIATNVTGATTSGATLSGGTAAGTSYRLTVSIPGQYPEVFDNIGAGLSGNALWTALANAINNGTSSQRGPSNIVIASVGAATATPVLTSVTLASGTDGVATINSSLLIGYDVLPQRTGMYALRGTGVAQADLCDLSDTTTFSTQVAFGLDIGCYMVATTAAGDTITNAVSELGNAGIDSFTIKVMFGDWVYWNDTYNQVPYRMTSPQGPVMGMLCNLSPQNSTLNRQLQGLVGTQKSITAIQYSSSDLQLLGSSQMDVIANPEPGGAYFACRFGKNASSNPTIFGDEYTKVTYFLAKSILVIGGKFVGQTQTYSERNAAKTALLQFLWFQWFNGIIGYPDVPAPNASTLPAAAQMPYQVVLDGSNNNQTTVALGYQYAYIKVVYLGIVRYFIIDLEGGASVSISTTPPLQ